MSNIVVCVCISLILERCSIIKNIRRSVQKNHRNSYFYTPITSACILYKDINTILFFNMLGLKIFFIQQYILVPFLSTKTGRNYINIIYSFFIKHKYLENIKICSDHFKGIPSLANVWKAKQHA